MQVAKYTIDRAAAGGSSGVDGSLYRERIGEGSLYQLKHIPHTKIISVSSRKHNSLAETVSVQIVQQALTNTEKKLNWTVGGGLVKIGFFTVMMCAEKMTRAVVEKIANTLALPRDAIVSVRFSSQPGLLANAYVCCACLCCVCNCIHVY